jgi:hypothetical protein
LRIDTLSNSVVASVPIGQAAQAIVYEVASLLHALDRGRYLAGVVGHLRSHSET